MALERTEFVGLRLLLRAMATCMILVSSVGWAQDGGPIIIGQRDDLKYFEVVRLEISIEGYWRYRLDESTNSAGVTTKTVENLFRESLGITTEAFIGDPNLISLDLNVNFRLSQESIDSDTLSNETRTSESVSEYDVSALILGRSKTPLTIYSRRSQVLLDRQFADSLDSISTEHGVRLLLNSDFLPQQFQYFHREQIQTGRFSGTDSEIIQDSFAWQGRIRATNGHRFWWDYTLSIVDEAGQILAPNSFTKHDAFINHTYDFGADSQHSIRSAFRIYQESGLFPVDRYRLDETLRLAHSKTFETKYVYLFDQQKRRLSDQTTHRGVASFRHDLFDSLTTSGEIGASMLSISEGNFESTQYFGNLALKYQKKVPKGVIHASANVNYNHQSDGERGASIFITDEPYSFGPSGIITLARRNIVSASIVITDLPGLIIYLEGADYTVRVLGDSIEITRVLGGAIAGGQSVLITYQIGPEPENTTDTLGFGTTVRYRFVDGPLRGLSPYVRYRNQTQNRSVIGLVAFQENEFDDLIVGVDYDLGHVSLTAEYQIHDSTLSPFNTIRFEGRYNNRINNKNSISINAYFQETDRVDDDLRTTVTNITSRWATKHRERLRSSISGTWRTENDSMGSNSDAYEVSMDINWRHRQTVLYGSLRGSWITSNTRDATSQTLTFGARREF
ncbi:MAG: hypothetical protein JKY43_06460 [Phycisphaerales bacterium]|nr:hypothetical protein [Phycisphaerales bacterium]